MGLLKDVHVDWKSIVGTVAPTIAAALGGPLAGAGVRALSEAVLGKPDGTEKELAAAIATASPEILAKMREADAAFAVRMKELDIDLERIGAADRDSARQREIKTGDVWTPRLLAGLIIVGWFVMQWYLVTHVIPAEMREIVLRGLGTLDLAVGLVLGYYFGSSSGSTEKSRTIDKLLG